MKEIRKLILSHLTILYIIIILILFQSANSINKENKKSLNLKRRILYLNKLKEKDKNNINDKDQKKEEDEKRNDRGNDEKDKKVKDELFKNITEYYKKIDDLNTEIFKSKIIIIFLSVFTVVLFLVIIIYSSIKCFILCTNKIISDYQVSDINSNKFGEVYFEESGEESFGKKERNDNGAPINAANDNKQYDTFNPDNFDKKLYKPYKGEDLL